MTTNSTQQNKNIFTLIKFVLASISLTSLFGIWNFFSKNSREMPEAATPTPESALPTLVPSVLENQAASGQNLHTVTKSTPQATATPVIEKVVVSSSGSSGGGSSSKTSSSR